MLFHIFLMNLSHILGLDPSEYRRQGNQSEHNEEEALLGAQLSDEEKYRDCDRFKYACKACGNLNSVDAVFSGVVSSKAMFFTWPL